MKTITEYREKLKQLSENLGRIKQNCIHENRDPNADERQTMKQIITEIKETEDIIATLQDSQDTIDRLNNPEGRKVPPENPEKNQQRQRDQFGSFGEFMAAVMRADMPGGHIDPRLRLEMRAASGLSESVPSDGGLTIARAA